MHTSHYEPLRATTKLVILFHSITYIRLASLCAGFVGQPSKCGDTRHGHISKVPHLLLPLPSPSLSPVWRPTSRRDELPPPLLVEVVVGQRSNTSFPLCAFGGVRAKRASLLAEPSGGAFWRSLLAEECEAPCEAPCEVAIYLCMATSTTELTLFYSTIVALSLLSCFIKNAPRLAFARRSPRTGSACGA